jgi:hypothetical protein
MFDSLDATLEAMLRSDMPSGSEQQVAISFARPDADFAATVPTLNLFLHRIVENRELRDRVPAATLQDERYRGSLAPVRVDCHYLVTAWAASGQPNPERTEHFLLGWALKLLLQHRAMPENLLQGVMKKQPLPIPLATIQDPGEPRGDFWIALGGKPRAALDCKATVCVVPGEAEDLGPAVQSTLFETRLREPVAGESTPPVAEPP